MAKDSAERQRRYRDRQRAGRRIVAIEIDVVRTEAMLAEAGYLPPYGTDDPDEIRLALEQAIQTMEVAKMRRDT